MTVGENIAYPLKLRKLPVPERTRRVDEMLRLVELEGYDGRYPRELSGGQQQRVAVARALAFQPDLLLMDEPLGALDRALRIGMQEEIRRIHRDSGATILYVTHDQEEALTMSDRVAIMREGQIRQVGPPRELYERPADRFVATFFGECTLVPAEQLGPASGDRGARAHAGPGSHRAPGWRVARATTSRSPSGRAASGCTLLLEIFPCPPPSSICSTWATPCASSVTIPRSARSWPAPTRTKRGTWRIGQAVTFGFAPRDAVAVGGER